MDLNPQFTAVSSFRPAGDGGELKLFDLTGIKLVHGWLVDPESPEFDVISKVEDYDASVNLVVSADHLTKGQLVRASEDFQSLVLDVGNDWTPEDRQKVEDGGYRLTIWTMNNNLTHVLTAIIIHDFLERTSSQLTYYGYIFSLAFWVQLSAYL